ncbi:MAG TPA: MerR family transcriptional regulator [Steroidobacteraceae bacterium]|nr:MerR family transcriptional regulator [Steroidobacteraceae bacterium]
MSTHPSRLLSIGEFAAATQLSPKALRIYDEQRLLPPARIDTATGYRYYTSDQVAVGRLVRTLREMNLSLTDIANVVGNSNNAEIVLAQLAQEIDQRYAREKRAYHAALVLLRKPSRAEAPEITQRARPDTTVAVQPFVANRYDFVEKFRVEARAASAMLTQAGLVAAHEPSCALIDPLSDDDGRLEIVVPVTTPARIPQGITLRQLPAATCAVIATSARHAHASELAGALDALFDWFDRSGCRALEAPLVSIGTDAAGLHTEIVWAFEQAAPAR